MEQEKKQKTKLIIIILFIIAIIFIIGLMVGKNSNNINNKSEKLTQELTQEELSKSYKIQNGTQAINCVKSAKNDIESALISTKYADIKSISDIEFKGEKAFDKDRYYTVIIKGNATGNINGSGTPSTIGFILDVKVYKLLGNFENMKIVDTSPPYIYHQEW